MANDTISLKWICLALFAGVSLYGLFGLKPMIDGLSWDGKITPGAILTAVTILMTGFLAFRAYRKEQRERDEKRLISEAERTLKIEQMGSAILEVSTEIKHLVEKWADVEAIRATMAQLEKRIDSFDSKSRR